MPKSKHARSRTSSVRRPKLNRRIPLADHHSPHTGQPAAQTIAECAREAVARLVAAGIPADDARVDVQVLGRAILQWSAADWLSRHTDPASADFRERLASWIDRRAAHEPVAYITGEREFYGRAFRVTPDVLIPRPETELVVDAALDAIDRTLRDATDSPVVADIGTGSGCLSVTLACERPVRVIATDVSEAALRVARTNAERHGVAQRIAWLEASVAWTPLNDVDLIVSNPPYVATRTRMALPADVRLFEPELALYGGNDGLEVIRQLVAAAVRVLNAEGRLVFEIGAGQAAAVRALIDGYRPPSFGGLEWVETRADLAGIPRVVIARRVL